MMAPRAKRSLGQHFLVSEAVVARIIETVRFVAAPAAGVVEVGPGRGALTGGLAALGKPLWAVEMDGELAAALRTRYPAVRVTEADARGFDWCSLWRVSGLHPWLFVGNLPYNAGTEILRQALLRRDTFCGLVVMLQREVAQKFCAEAGEVGYGPYAAWAAPWWERRSLFTVKPGAFRPQPKVTSTVCVFAPRQAAPLSTLHQMDYWEFIRRVFRQPRKTLLANVAVGPHGREDWRDRLASLGIPERARTEELSPFDLLEVFSADGGGRR